ncbi:MAG: glycosyl hydrolase [Leptospiraceae bacterium]|nr:MAG: glycosyl hydrolase [Leptospiraceae bacterium]
MSSLLFADNLQDESFKNFLNYIEQKNQSLEKIYQSYPYNQLEIKIPEPEQKQFNNNIIKELNNKNDSIKTTSYNKSTTVKESSFSFPSNLEPYPKEKVFYKYNKPEFIKAIYINNRTPFKKDFNLFIQNAKKHGINTLVIDVQSKIISKEILDQLRKENFYLIARIVVFHLGFKEYPPTTKHLKQIHSLIELAEKSVQNGFQEIQLDYIRFADYYYPKGLTLGKRYRFIAGILKVFEDRLRPYGVRIGADIFGRIPFYEHDYIGQKIEIFDRYLDHLHPMLYPSHFYGMNDRINNPYQTIYDGVVKAKKRAKNAEIIPYIQVFKMSVKRTGLTYREYIKKQILACIDSNAKGFIAWNASNDYEELYKALDEIFKINMAYERK